MNISINWGGGIWEGIPALGVFGSMGYRVEALEINRFVLWEAQDSHVSAFPVLCCFADARLLFPGVSGSIYGSVKMRLQLCKYGSWWFIFSTTNYFYSGLMNIVQRHPDSCCGKGCLQSCSSDKGVPNNILVCVGCPWTCPVIVAFHTSPSTANMTYLCVCWHLYQTHCASPEGGVSAMSVASFEGLTHTFPEHKLGFCG